MSTTYPPFVNTGTPIIRKNLQPGNRFEIEGYASVYTVIERIDNFVRILGADGWIRRTYDDNPVNETIVYLL